MWPSAAEDLPTERHHLSGTGRVQRLRGPRHVTCGAAVRDGRACAFRASGPEEGNP